MFTPKITTKSPHPYNRFLNNLVPIDCIVLNLQIIFETCIVRRRLSRLDVYRVDTYSRVLGKSRVEATKSNVGRSTSADYGLFLARAARGQGGASQRSHTTVPDGRASSRRGRGHGCGYTPRTNQTHSHWAYFRWVSFKEVSSRGVRDSNWFNSLIPWKYKSSLLALLCPICVNFWKHPCYGHGIQKSLPKLKCIKYMISFSIKYVLWKKLHFSSSLEVICHDNASL